MATAANSMNRSCTSCRDSEVEPLAGAPGARICGVDISAEPDDDVIAAIRCALLDHRVIDCRDRPLTVEQRGVFGRRFVTLRIHPQYLPPGFDPGLAKDPLERDNVGGVWHSDIACLEASGRCERAA